MKQIRFLIIAILLLATSSSWAQKFHDAVNEQIYNGNVKSITEISNGTSQVINFNNDGSYSMKELSNLRRNKAGYLVSYDLAVNGTTGHAVLTYDSKHRVVKQNFSIGDGTIVVDNTFNDDGTIRIQTITMSSGGMSQTETTTYSYQKFDDHGNWTMSIGTVGGQQYYDSRTILYW